MAAETGFKINGVIYEHPFVSWDLDDAERMFDKTGLVLEDWILAEEPEADPDIVRKFRDPKVLRTLAAIAYWKQHRDEDFDIVYRDIAGGVTVESLYQTLFAEDDAVPPASTTEPEKQSVNGTVATNDSSGNASMTSSARQDSLLEPTGMPV